MDASSHVSTGTPCRLVTVPNGTLVGRDAKCGRTLWDSMLPETTVTVVPRRQTGAKTLFPFAVSIKSPLLAKKAPMVNANEGHRKPQKHDATQLLNKVALSAALCIQLKATAPCRRMTPYNFWTRWPSTNTYHIPFYPTLSIGFFHKSVGPCRIPGIDAH